MDSSRSIGIMRINKFPLGFPLQGGRFPRAWLQPPRRFAPAGSSAHAPAASLSVQETSAIPAGVAALPLQSMELAD